MIVRVCHTVTGYCFLISEESSQSQQSVSVAIRLMRKMSFILNTLEVAVLTYVPILCDLLRHGIYFFSTFNICFDSIYIYISIFPANMVVCKTYISEVD